MVAVADKIRDLDASPLVVVKNGYTSDEIEQIFHDFKPKQGSGIAVAGMRLIKATIDMCAKKGEPIPEDMIVELMGRLSKTVNIEGRVGVAVVRKSDMFGRPGEIEDYGWISSDLIVTAGKNKIASGFAGTSPSDLGSFKYIGMGTGVTAAAAGDTALQTELTTQLNPDSTRATGTQSNPSGNVYQAVGTLTVDSAVAVTEFGIFYHTSAATGGGTLLDRTVFSAYNLGVGDGIQFTFQLTFS